MPIDARMVKWDESPSTPKIDPRLVKWNDNSTTDKVDSIGSRFAQGMKDPIDAGAQLLTHLLPDSVVNTVNKINNYIADKTGLVAKLPTGGIDEMLNKQEANYHAPQGIDFARIGGNLLSPANIAIGSKLPIATSLIGKIGTGALGGAIATPLTQPVFNSKNYLGDKINQAEIGAVSGGILPTITGSVSRVISPKASLNPNVQLLRNEGVTPTIGQTLGGISNRVEDKLQSLPIMGDMIARARNAANGQVETAAYNRALKPIGQELPQGLNGRDALQHTESTLKNAYDDVLTRIGAIKPDSDFMNGINNLQGMVNKLVMPKAEKMKFQSALQDVQQSLDSNGVMTSDAYKALESSLGSDAKKLATSQNIYDGKLSPAVKQLQQELKDMLSRQAGDKADELKAVNAGWANFKRVQNASSKLGADDGNFTPAQLQNAIRTLDKSKDKGAFARGSALMQDLGDAGKSVLTGKVPNSGTAERLMYGTGALASGKLNPAIPASLALGGALYTRPVQKLLNSAIASRPKSAASIAELLRNSNNYMLPASSAVGLGLLD